MSSDEGPLNREEALEAKQLADERLRALDLKELVKDGVLHVCTACKQRLPAGGDQCPRCGDWDTIIEVKL